MTNGAQFSLFSVIYSMLLNVLARKFLWPANLQGNVSQCITALNETSMEPLRSAVLFTEEVLG